MWCASDALTQHGRHAASDGTAQRNARRVPLSPPAPVQRRARYYSAATASDSRTQSIPDWNKDLADALEEEAEEPKLLLVVVSRDLLLD